MLENKELTRFYEDIQEDVRSGMLSEEESKNPEQIFTEFALSVLEEAGETENYRICYDEKLSKRGIEHKVNAYALYENYETLDLFITIYSSSNSIQTVGKTDAERAIDRLTKFFRNSIYKDYVNEIEESSEIFDIAQTLANVPEIKQFLTRVNIFLITNCEFKSELKPSDRVAGYLVFYRVIDINYLFNLSENSGVPIEIDFENSGILIPCIENQIDNDDYQSYLAVIPGNALASIYEQYGPRLLEQNVRSFLQFTGKINKGIRKTILEEPHMFLAFNNGIAATAEEVRIVDLPGNKGKGIGYVKDFQIVNGGQTTASIYHTWNKNKAEIGQIYVQLKLTIIKDRDNFAEIVGRIAEYANTQNRVSASDLSSNRENHVIIEKLSRTIWSPPKAGESLQTRWFYERSRGQYRNEKSRIGLTPSKRKQFERQNPREQMFTKELLAKYINSYREVYSRKKLVIGPHFVVRGSQKNYAQFLNYNFDQKPDNVYFEDAIALAILFKSAEKVYGVSPNAIGDMRYVTVPYTIAWIGHKIGDMLDLYKIWRKQEVSSELKDKLHEIMVKIENFIKKNAPGSLYGEWAKKEECWQAVKNSDLGISLIGLSDYNKSKTSPNRKRISDDEIQLAENELINEHLRSVHPKTWSKIESWGLETDKLTKYQRDLAYTLGKRVQNNTSFSETERLNGEKIIRIVAEQAPELFYEMDEFHEAEAAKKPDDIVITLELIEKIVKWDKKHKRLKPYEFRFMFDLTQGHQKLTEKSLRIAKLNYRTAKKFGFRDNDI